MTLAEIAGRIERLTDVVFGTSIRWFARHLASSRRQLCLKHSARSRTDPDLPDRLERMCGDAGLEPHHLELEIAETSIAGDAGVAHDVLIGLRRRGLGIALDDFGAGHASLPARLGMRVIAEGVEEGATRASLEELGCHSMPGNVLAPAMEPRAPRLAVAARRDLMRRRWRRRDRPRPTPKPRERPRGGRGLSGRRGQD